MHVKQQHIKSINSYSRCCLQGKNKTMKIPAGGVVLSLAFFARVALAQGPGQKPRTKQPTRTVTKKPTTKTTASTRPCNREACPPLSQKKYKICHVTGVATTETLCLPESGLTNHLKSHPGDYCGACSVAPSSKPSSNPSTTTNAPARLPTSNQTAIPTNAPTRLPTSNQTASPTNAPTRLPTSNPTNACQEITQICGRNKPCPLDPVTGVEFCCSEFGVSPFFRQLVNCIQPFFSM